MIEELMPNAETIAAIREIEDGGGDVFMGSIEEIHAAILGSPEPTDGFWVVRSGNLWVATYWRYFTDQNFTLQGIGWSREQTIETFRSCRMPPGIDKPEAIEFKDWPPLPLDHGQSVP